MSIKYSKFYRLLSLILICTMLFELLPANVFAAEEEEAISPAVIPEAEAVEIIEPVDEEKENQEATVLGEVEKLREENIKHFQLDDGSFVAVDYGLPVHYTTNDGEEWEDIDNTLVFSAANDTQNTQSTSRGVEHSQSKYTAENGDTTTAFAGNLRSGFLFSTGSDKYKISMSLSEDSGVVTDMLQTEGNSEEIAAMTVAADAVIENEVIDSAVFTEAVFNIASAAEISYPEMMSKKPAQVDATALQTMAVPVSDENSDERSLAEQVIPTKLKADVLYRDVFDGIDLKYELYSYNLKESIIVKELRDSYTFTFYLNMDNLTPALQEDGSITLTDEADEIAYLIPAPYMFDAAEAYSEAVSYSLTETASGAWALTVTADAEWINEAERTLPVTIDPTLIDQKKWSSSDKTFGVNYLVETSPSNTYPEKAEIFLGDRNTSSNKENRIFAGFDTLPSLPAGNEVINVQLMIGLADYASNHDSMSSFAAALHGVASTASRPSNYSSNYNWIKGMTWNSKPEIDPIVQDYVVLSSDKEGKYVSWDLTGLAKEWYADDSAVKVACLKMMDTSHTASYYAYSKFYGYGQGYGPMLAMNYRNVEGVEGYYSYQALGADRAGAAYISDYTGYLTIETPLVSLASGVNPFSINMVYNSSYFAKYNADYDVADKLGLTGMHFGSGMKLDLIQKMEIFNLQYEMGTSNTKKYLKYTDGDGTAHYFATDSEKDSTEKTYYDEDGLGLEAVIDSESQKNFTITNDKDQKMIFKRGFLSSIVDANENEIKINYNTSDGTPSASARISSVTQTNKGQPTVTIAKFGYETISGVSGYLTSMSDYAENLYTFQYSGGKLRTISRKGASDDAVKEVIVEFSQKYENNVYNNPVTGLYDCISGYQLRFTYDGGDHGRISSYYEKSNGETGAGANITRVPGEKTTYIDWGNDRTANTSDDIETTYLFDYAGRTVNAVSRDASGTVIGASNAVHTGIGDTDKKNNRTIRSASIGKAAMPQLRNGSFESEDASLIWTSDNNTGLGTGLANVVVKAENPRTGKKALKTYLATGKTGILGTHRNTLSMIVGQKYTVSAYVNTSGAYNIPDGKGVYLKVTNSNGETVQTSSKVNYKTDASIDDGWVRISLTFTAASSYAHTVYVCVDGVTGIVFVDDVQVEAGNSPSNRNMLDNGGMDSWKYDWKAQDDTEASFATGESIDGSYSMKITGSPTAEKYSHQTVELNQPGTQTYVLSGWAKANAVPDNVTEAEGDDAEERDSVKQFGLRAILTYKDEETKEYHYVPFDPDVTDWQFASLAIVPKQADKTVASMDVICTYEKNANTAYFDNISLVKEVAQTMRYDDDGNLESVQSTGNKEENSNYEDGNLKRIETGGNGDYTYDYDSKHNLTSASNGIAKEVYTIDAVGNTTAAKLTAASGTGISMNSSTTYTSSNNLVKKVTDSRGYSTEYDYVIKDNPTGTKVGYMLGLPHSTKNAKGTEVITNYNDFGRSTQSYISNVVSVANTYDSRGQLTTIDRGGYRPGSSTKVQQQYNFTYDDFGNRKDIFVGTRKLATNNYADHNGLLTKVVYGNVDSVEYTYDNLGRKIHTKVNTENNTNNGFPFYMDYDYKYTGDGQLYEMYDQYYGLTYRYTYDTIGRLIVSELSKGTTTQLQTWHKYDEHNRLTAQSWKMLDNSFNEGYTYDEHGRLKKKTTTLPNGHKSEIQLSYGDALGRLSTVKTPVSTDYYNYLAGSGTNTTTPLVSAMSHNAANGNSLETVYFTYAYDKLGNITGSTEQYGTATSTKEYTYDAQSQLLSETYYGGSATYTYDTYGNICTKKQTNFAGSTVNYTYNYENSQWRDLLTSISISGSSAGTGGSYTYDAIGNPKQYYNVNNNTTWTLGWFANRALRQAKTSSSTINYEYDVDGLRTKKNVNGVVHNYIYAGGKLLRDSYTQNSTSYVLDFVYDQSGRPYMLYLKEGTAAQKVFYYLLNYQGDVVRIVDDDGVTVAEYRYDAWGKSISANTTSDSTVQNLAAINPLRYRGYYFDTETGWYYLQSRYYDPGLGRFINADSSEFLGVDGSALSLNLFVYCGNNPVNLSDQTGTFAISTAILIGVGVAAICGLANGLCSYYDGGSFWGGFAIGAITGLIGYAVGYAVCYYAPVALPYVDTFKLAVGLRMGASLVCDILTPVLNGESLSTESIVTIGMDITNDFVFSTIFYYYYGNDLLRAVFDGLIDVGENRLLNSNTHSCSTRTYGSHYFDNQGYPRSANYNGNWHANPAYPYEDARGFPHSY